MAFAALTKYCECMIEQCQAHTAVLRSGVNHKVTNEGAGPALCDGDHAQRVARHEAQLTVELWVGFEHTKPAIEISDTTAAVLTSKHQQLVDVEGVVVTQYSHV
jgi:hypothetical protein